MAQQLRARENLKKNEEIMREKRIKTVKRSFMAFRLII